METLLRPKPPEVARPLSVLWGGEGGGGPKETRPVSRNVGDFVESRTFVIAQPTAAQRGVGPISLTAHPK